MRALFMGEFEHTLDDKGRVIVPAKLRDQIRPLEDGEGFIATHAPENCLYLYTPREWEGICQRLAKLPKGTPGLRQFQRRFYSRAEQLTLDRQGRILIPERLRNKVGIDRDLVLAGCQDRIEVWSKAAWTGQVDDDVSYEEQYQTFLGAEEEPVAPTLEE